MAKAVPLVLENRALKVEIDRRDLAAHVTVKETGETLRMAGGQSDDVWMASGDQRVWKGFADGPITARKLAGKRPCVEARLPHVGLVVRIELDGADVVFRVAPAAARGKWSPRDVLYPRHFLLPRREGAYATFPLGQGSIIPATETALFHHREGYSEAVAHWLGGYTGATGYVGIAETRDDLYQAVDHRADQPASVFFHWTGQFGKLAYPRVARYRFAAGLGYVQQAKAYREYCRQAGLFRSLADKAKENPNVERLIGSPIICALASVRREKSFKYEFTKFTDLAQRVEDFRRVSGLARGLVHVDGWGVWGYDAMHPDTLPPNGDCGGVAGLTEMSKRVKALGYLFALHDQYIDFFFHAPSFDERLSTVTEDGRPVRVNQWAGGPCGHLCYTQVPRFLRRNLYEGVRRYYPMYHNSPPVWQICEPTAYYLDCFCRTVECWSKGHPVTRSESRRLQSEILRIAHDGAEGKKIVLSVEHPRDFAIPYLEFAWSLGHFSADVLTTAGSPEYRAVGIPVPLWHLVFHDALCLPSPGNDLLEMMLYAQAPYFFLRGAEIDPAELGRKKAVLELHKDAAFAEMTDHQLLSADGQAQKCVYDGGLEVEANKADGTYRVNTGRARTDGWQKL